MSDKAISQNPNQKKKKIKHIESYSSKVLAIKPKKNVSMQFWYAYANVMSNNMLLQIRDLKDIVRKLFKYTKLK